MLVKFCLNAVLMAFILASFLATVKELATAKIKIKTLEEQLSSLKANNLKEKLLHGKRVAKLQTQLKMVLTRAKNAQGDKAPSPKPVSVVDPDKHNRLQEELDVRLLVGVPFEALPFRSLLSRCL